MNPPKSAEELKAAMSITEFPVLSAYGGGSPDTAKVFFNGHTSTYGQYREKKLFKFGDERIERIPDGWGGFTEKKVGNTLDDLAKYLISVTPTIETPKPVKVVEAPKLVGLNRKARINAPNNGENNNVAVVKRRQARAG
jgi:hypothetical protein